MYIVLIVLFKCTAISYGNVYSYIYTYIHTVCSSVLILTDLVMTSVRVDTICKPHMYIKLMVLYIALLNKYICGLYLRYCGLYQGIYCLTLVTMIQIITYILQYVHIFISFTAPLHGELLR